MTVKCVVLGACKNLKIKIFYIKKQSTSFIAEELHLVVRKISPWHYVTYEWSSRIRTQCKELRKRSMKNSTYGLTTSRLPTSKLPTSKLISSRLPTSKLPISRLPTSWLPTCTLPTSRLSTSRLPTSRHWYSICRLRKVESWVAWVLVEKIFLNKCSYFIQQRGGYNLVLVIKLRHRSYQLRRQPRAAVNPVG